MTKTMNHTNCTHPATKAGRAKCRKDRAARIATLRNEADTLIVSYYNGAEFDSVIYRLMDIFPEVKEGYFENDLDAEELIALATACKLSL